MKQKPANHHLGLEWVGDQFRAGVFDECWRLRGKAVRSAKTQRGLAEMLKRLARCALDAVDDADLQPEVVAAAGIVADRRNGNSSWSPDQLNQLAAHLPPHLGGNLLTAGRTATIMWAVHEHEFASEPKSWLGWFSEPEPRLFAAERTEPDRVKPMAVRASAVDAADRKEPNPAALAQDLLAALHLAQPEFLLLVGPEYEDTLSAGVKQLCELLSGTGLHLPVHVPKLGEHVGTWAAARLAARTFSR